MLIRRLVGKPLGPVLAAANAGWLEGNLIFNRCAFLNFAESRARVTLRVQTSRGPGHRRGFSGRRLVSACWHAHYEFLGHLFRLYPDVSVSTGWATYHNRADFLAKADATGSRNIGSVMSPLRASEACDCTGSEINPIRNALRG